MSDLPTAFDDVKMAYSRLQDDISRSIFNWRLRFFLQGNYDGLLDMLKEVSAFYKAERARQALPPYRDFVDCILHSLGKKRPIILFGAGAALPYSIRYLAEHGCAPAQVYDNDPAKEGTVIEGFTVLPGKALPLHYQAESVLITSQDNYPAIRQQLEEAGIPAEAIFSSNFSTTKHSETFYFSEEFMLPGADEIYVDGGMFDGDTVQEFIDAAGGQYQKIYGFEPDAGNLRALRFAPSDTIEVIQKGLWSHETTLHFKAHATLGSAIHADGDTSLAVTSIDRCIGGPVTMLKLDIEGAELEALKGAEKTLKTYKPRCAICLYHKLEDILTLPAYLAKLVPEYRFYIRHHMPYWWDTVLYAVAD